jgi:hypothetical protein
MARPLPAASAHQPPAQRLSALTQEAAAQTEAGLGIPIDEIARWVESWGTPAELPMPKARRVL